MCALFAMSARTPATARRRWRRSLGLIGWGLCLLSTIAAPGAGQAAEADRDLHRYWDARCKDCHGDAGPFARSTLRVQDGRLLGAHHEQNLDLFLQHHYLTADLVAPVQRMLAAQVGTPPLFAQHCSACHTNASTFARQSLTLRGDELVGLRSGRPVAEHLQSHGGLAPAQIPSIVESLKRVLRETTPNRDER